MHSSNANAPRRWWLAAVLALAARGTGQLYNGQPGKAACAWALPVILLVAANHVAVPIVAQFLLLAAGAVLVWAVADATAIAFAHRRAHPRSRWNRRPVVLAAVAVVWLTDALVLATLVVRVTKSPQGGMRPAIAAGDHVVVDLTAYAVREPQRGDIIAFRSPVDDRSRRISRIVGLPGETVEVREKQVLVDGRILRENWARHRDPHVLWPSSPSPRDHYGPVRLPADAYFVLDDDRDVGFDSRYWDRPVRRRQIEGRVGVYAFSRNPREGIRWHRIGTAVHRDVPVPTDGPAALYAAMGDGPALGAASFPGSAATILVLVLATPLLEIRRRRRRWVTAAAPYASVPPAPACVPAAVRHAELPAAAGVSPLVRLQALADLGSSNGRPLDVPLAECLGELSVSRIEASRLGDVLRHLDRLATGARVRDPGVRGLLSWRRAGVLQRLARADGDTERLAEALTVYRTALAGTPRSQAPLRWAAIQNDLGTALQQQGEQTGDVAALEEAVAAYRASLAVRTARRTPLDWATTQHNLGNCLRAIGERDDRTEHLLAACEAYRAALRRRTRAADPIGHAMTLNNLALALRLIGARRGDAGVILQARELHGDSLELLLRFAPAFAAVPEQNLAEDDELLRRFGVLPTSTASRVVPSANAA